MTLYASSPFQAEKEMHTPDPGVWVSLEGLVEVEPGRQEIRTVRKLITMDDAGRIAQHLLGIVLDHHEYSL